MVDGAAADTGPDQPDWIDVAQASVQWVVAKQSVYARVKAGTVRSRRLDGMLQVSVRDLNRHYARRETDTETDSEDAGWVRADLLASEQGRRRFAEGEAKALHVQLGNMGEQVKLLTERAGGGGDEELARMEERMVSGLDKARVFQIEKAKAETESFKQVIALKDEQLRVTEETGKKLVQVERNYSGRIERRNRWFLGIAATVGIGLVAAMTALANGWLDMRTFALAAERQTGQVEHELRNERLAHEAAVERARIAEEAADALDYLVAR